MSDFKKRYFDNLPLSLILVGGALTIVELLLSFSWLLPETYDYDVSESQKFLYFLMSVLGSLVLSAAAGALVCAVWTFPEWIMEKAGTLKEIPGSDAKIKPVSYREKILKYYDFRGFD